MIKIKYMTDFIYVIKLSKNNQGLKLDLINLYKCITKMNNKHSFTNNDNDNENTFTVKAVYGKLVNHSRRQHIINHNN